MKKGLFITDKDINRKDALTNGEIKKILDQIYSLNIKEQIYTESLVLPRPMHNSIYKFFTYLLLDIYKKVKINPDIYDFFYIRRIAPVNYSLIKKLKFIKIRNAYCKILYELPTYPYDKEHKMFSQKIHLFIDKLFRVKLRKYVDRIITVSDDKNIFGVPTINIINGICFKNIKVHMPGLIMGDINIICVSSFQYWHGCDRLIEGLNDYYKNEVDIKIYVHFIGEGPYLNIYRNMVQKYNLLQYFHFYGLLSGEELTDIFNKADIGLCGLGGHRKGIYLSSELKSREYLARGIPMIASTKIDIIPENCKFCLYISEDDSPVNIGDVIIFYKNLINEKNINDLSNEIRNFGEKCCDILKTMQPIVNYIIE